MASEMIERVAKAMQFAAQEDWDLQIPTDEGALVLARAAIEAMREPTEAMLAASEEDAFSPDVVRWRAMIDAALSPTPDREG